MKSFIVYPSALQFWMRAASSNNNYCTNLDPCGCNRNSLRNVAEKFKLNYPLHIAVPYNTDKSRGSDFICHVIPRRLPENSFVKISEDVYVASPEMCFLQAAAVEPVHRLVSIGNDLCGNYYFSDNAEYGQKARKSITTVEQLKAFISRGEHLNGLYKAGVAVKYILNGSFSPYESMIAAVAMLPLSYGGFSLPRAILNYNISLSKNAAEFMKRDSLCCDMVWPFIRVAFEYDSNLTHLKASQHSYDKRRANALADSGYTLITATREDFKYFRKYEELFDLIRRSLNMRLRKDRMAKYEDKRREVFYDLFRNF